MVWLAKTISRNFIWEEKYKNKDPEKYHKLKDGGHPGEDNESSLDHLTNRFSRGMSKLMHFGHGDEDEEEQAPGEQGSKLSKIQLTRR